MYCMGAGLLDSYANGTYTTQDLAYEVLSGSSESALSDVSLALTTVGESVATGVTTMIDGATSNIQQAYIEMMSNLNQLQSFMVAGDTSVEAFARQLSIWQIPTAQLQNQNVISTTFLFIS